MLSIFFRLCSDHGNTFHNYLIPIFLVIITDFCLPYCTAMLKYRNSILSAPMCSVSADKCLTC